jgi:hypothetical protein
LLIFGVLVARIVKTAGPPERAPLPETVPEITHEKARQILQTFRGDSSLAKRKVGACSPHLYGPKSRMEHAMQIYKTRRGITTRLARIKDFEPRLFSP